MMRAAVDGRGAGRRDRGGRPAGAVDAEPGLQLRRTAATLEIELRGWDLARADVSRPRSSAAWSVEGVTDVRVSRREGQPEERLVLDRERISELGLSVRRSAGPWRPTSPASRRGASARAATSSRSWSACARADRLTADDLERGRCAPPPGDTVPLSALVERRRGRGPVEIDRVDGQRVTYVTATSRAAWPSATRSEQVQRALDGLTLPEGFSILFGGQYEEQQAAAQDFTDRDPDGAGPGLHADGGPVRALPRSADRDARGAHGADRRRAGAAAHRHHPQHPERHGPGDADRHRGQQRHRPGGRRSTCCAATTRWARPRR
jgi:hypothetical protein